MTRREWLCATGLAVGSRTWARAQMSETKRPARDALDHLLIGASDRDAAIDWFERLTGVRPIVGGSHPGMGTCNALASLGPGQYVEIIAPDPAQSSYAFHLDVRRLREPRPITWAASITTADATAAAARAAGLSVFGPMDGSRTRPDGTTLRWRTAGVSSDLGTQEVDPVPFFIEWGAGTRHPSLDAPGGCRLITLELGHPNAERLQKLLAALGINASVEPAPAPVLRATIATPRGTVDL